MKIAKNLVEYSEMYNVAVNDPEIKRRYDFYMSGVMDEASRIGRAKREGLAKGETIGIEKGKDIGKLEAAVKLKAKGLEDDFISETLELPLETVEKL